MDHEVRIKLENAAGDKLTPQRVELGDLLALLHGLRNAILLNAGIEDLERPPVGVSLVALETGSVVPVLRPATSLERSTDEVLEAIEKRAPGLLNRPAALAAHKAFEVARERRWVVHLGGRGRSVTVSELEPFPAPEPEPEPAFVRGTTTLYGKCVMVGGPRTPRVKMTLLQGGSVELRASHDIARQLGQRIFEVVGIRGEATWNAETWRIVEFTPFEVLDYEQAPVEKAFAELREVIGDAFDTDAAIDRMRSLRSDE